jgi:hypothetical protein
MFLSDPYVGWATLISSNAVSGQLRGHRGGGIYMSFVRVADDTLKWPR